MTNRELVKKYEFAQAKSSKLVDWFCLIGSLLSLCLF